MLLVQDYLLTHSLGQLAKEHGVYCGFAKEPYKWACNYDMIEARDDDPIAQECRGLILTTPDGKLFEPKEINGRRNFDHIVPGETRVMGMGFRRFFNEGQGSAAPVNFSDPFTQVQTKHDGTLISAHFDFHRSKWCASTRSVPEADLPLDNFGDFTFRTLFDKAFRETMGVEFVDYAENCLDQGTTYMFELTTPYNRIVCQYNDFRITLLGARDLRTMNEIDIHRGATWGGTPWSGYMCLPDLPRVKTYSLDTPANIIKWVAELNPLDEQGEGVVVVDKHFNRVKIKNPKHGLLSRTKDKLGSSIRNCLELALSGKEDDFISVLPPEIVQRVLECKEGVRLLIRKTDDAYGRIVEGLGAMTSQKDFALAVQSSGCWQTPLFKRHAGKVNSTREFIDQAKKDGEWSSGFLDTLLQLIDKQTIQ